MQPMHISIRWVRFIGLGILVGIIAFISIFGVVQTTRIDHDLRTLAEEHRPLLREIDNLLVIFGNITNEFAFFIIQEQTDLKPLLVKVKTLLIDIEAFKKQLIEEGEVELTDGLIMALKEYRVAMVAYSQELKVRRMGQAVRSWEGTLLEREKQIREVANALKNHVYESMMDVENEILARTSWTRQLGSILGILGVLAGLVVATLLQRALAMPIKNLIGVSRAIAEGDLSRDVGSATDDEIGALSTAISTMLQNLRRIVGEIQKTSKKVDEVASDLERHTDEVSKGASIQGDEIMKVSGAVREMDRIVGEVSSQFENLSSALDDSSSSTLELKSSIDEVSAFADQLASEVEKISSSLIEMDASMNQNVEHLDSLSASSEQTATTAEELAASSAEVGRFAQESRQLAEDVMQLAKERGSNALEELVKVTRRNKDLVDSYSRVINSLGEKSASIGDIVDVIREVADQISLLSINASIIAAQAGEHGKGFAVVAEEVGNLSVTTTESVQRIEEVIKSVRKDVDEAVKMMREVSEGVESSISTADQTEVVLKDIADHSSQSADRARQIAEAASEQVNRGQDILKVVTKNLEEVLQIKRTVDEQQGGSKLIVASTDEIMEATRKLKHSTSEQARESGIISQGVAETLNFSRKMKEALGKEQEASREIVRSLGMIADVADKTGTAMKALEAVVHDLSTLADKLGPEVARFKLKESDEQS
ncbi:MAG: methyl-accepting chemotaxis protein [bacterium]